MFNVNDRNGQTISQRYREVNEIEIKKVQRSNCR